jgi:D-sedoheptulose 7-phosphate isomerase
MKLTYYSNYLKKKNKKLFSFDLKKIIPLEDKLVKIKNKCKKIIFLGNGVSAAIVNHFSIDFNKNLGVITKTFNNLSISCYANDFGQHKWIQKAIELNISKEDLVIFVSSSGDLSNHLIATRFCKKKKIFQISFTGFRKNKLSELANISIIVNSKNYNIIENIYSIWMLMALDKLKNFKIH